MYRLKSAIFVLMVCLVPIKVFEVSAADEKPADPVFIGLTAEYGLNNSFSAQAVEMGIRIAISQINEKGGVLNGRPLILETRDDRSVPARAIHNVKEFDRMKDLVAVFGARFSPVLVELIPLVHDCRLILLDPWASADRITDHDYKPSYTFRLSLKDSLAMPTMLSHAIRKGSKKAGILLPNTAWGRSNMEAAEDYAEKNPGIKLVRSRWYNWGDTSLIDLYEDLLSAGADVVILVANDREGGIFVNELLTLPEEKRCPILSHWGVTGGTFFENIGKGLDQIDFSVVQTFSFFRADPVIRDRFMTTAHRLYSIESYEKIKAPVGVGHAYDLTHLLAMAIEKAGSTNRSSVRDALENLGHYHGLVADLKQPFTADNHDALSLEHVFMAAYRSDGALIPLSKSSD